MRAGSRHATARRLSQVGADAYRESPSFARRRASVRRLMTLIIVAAGSMGVVTAAAMASPRPAIKHTAATTWSAQAKSAAKTTAAAQTPRHPSQPAPTSPQPLAPLTLTAFDRQSCPAAATACVDLTRHLTWLQSAGHVTFGPIRAEPGPPGSAHATPRGTFRVSWKAGPSFVSNIYHEPMPWAVFFAPGGIAFHAGSLTTPSHGCVHLTIQNAYYYNGHLPVGAEVVVF